MSVEGPVTIERGFDADERRAIAHRYLGPELGDKYYDGTAADAEDNVTVRLTPERWLSVDYNKMFG